MYYLTEQKHCIVLILITVMNVKKSHAKVSEIFYNLLLYVLMIHDSFLSIVLWNTLREKYLAQEFKIQRWRIIRHLGDMSLTEIFSSLILFCWEQKKTKLLRNLRNSSRSSWSFKYKIDKITLRSESFSPVS